MKRLLIAGSAAFLVHLGGLSLPVDEPRAVPRVNVDPGRVSVAMVEVPKKQPEDQPEPEEKPDPKPHPEPKPEPETEPDPEPTPEKTEKTRTKKTKKTSRSSRRTRGARWVKKADYRSNPSPDYPERSRRLGEEGTAILKVRVDRAGRAEWVRVQESSGHDRLDREALRTVKKWRFTPAEHAGTQIGSTVLVPIRFRLD